MPNRRAAAVLQALAGLLVGDRVAVLPPAPFQYSLGTVTSIIAGFNTVIVRLDFGDGRTKPAELSYYEDELSLA